MKNNEKVWYESTTTHHGNQTWGMSSALGATTDDLPRDLPAGSLAFDYTTSTVYKWDGVEWR